jgi:hypothetical protein
MRFDLMGFGEMANIVFRMFDNHIERFAVERTLEMGIVRMSSRIDSDKQAVTPGYRRLLEIALFVNLITWWMLPAII